MLTRILYMFKRFPIKASILTVWICLLLLTQSFSLIAQYGSFLFLGIVGAIFANATGAGGGVVFVPFFNQLALSSETIVATSFAIQCFGMTAGAITWYTHYCGLRSQPNNHVFLQWHSLHRGLIVSVPFSICGVLVAQYLLYEYTSYIQSALHFYFGLFSIALALAIFGSIPLMRKQSSKSKMLIVDVIVLAFISLAGGIITAWLSIGVGELVAVYLILRGFNIGFAIALAVILSSFTVLAAIVYHLWVSQAVYWHIVLYAGAGAILGGMVAKHVVLRFSAIKLKVFFGTWVLVMGLAGLPI